MRRQTFQACQGRACQGPAELLAGPPLWAGVPSGIRKFLPHSDAPPPRPAPLAQGRRQLEAQYQQRVDLLARALRLRQAAAAVFRPRNAAVCIQRVARGWRCRRAGLLRRVGVAPLLPSPVSVPVGRERPPTRLE